ncbi:hypothetical protein AZE42_08344 [Rhizopogon vesiculosus]|uniref:Uncharacterized protein n=1 Tax=Rhizopogon vesiculosus TaxID=180088 RepID=A0A1J8QCY0_9AGAM|nr:hypothetical protein AZE42_08344 [Rhizopogon vesiculosus]
MPLSTLEIQRQQLLRMYKWNTLRQSAGAVGLRKAGTRTSLKDFKVQEQYRAFVGEKLHKFWAEKQTKDGQDNILILFRKLREGIFASKRSDAFAIEGTQTSSILSHLLPELYTSASIQPPIASVLILLLHHLTAGYPSQRTYFDHLSRLSPNVLDRTSEAYGWVSNLAMCLRTRNYIRFDALSRRDVYERLLPASTSSDEKRNRLDRLPRDALQALVDRLRNKARDGTWMVLRSAYRELSASDESRAWLIKCLLLSSEQASTSDLSFEEWMDGRCQEGHLRPKEGAKGRWIVCKVR